MYDYKSNAKKILAIGFFYNFRLLYSLLYIKFIINHHIIHKIHYQKSVSIYIHVQYRS